MENIISLGRFDYFRLEDLKKKNCYFSTFFRSSNTFFSSQLVFGTPLHSRAKALPFRSVPKTSWNWKSFWRSKKKERDQLLFSDHFLKILIKYEDLLQSCGFWNAAVDQKLSFKSAKKHFILSTRPIQAWLDHLQKVKRRRWTHRWMRQDQRFPAQIELALCDTHVRF